MCWAHIERETQLIDFFLKSPPYRCRFASLLSSFEHISCKRLALLTGFQVFLEGKSHRIPEIGLF